MPFETLQNVPQSEKKQYLRVATIASKTALTYFYIGTDPEAHEVLSSSFNAGYTAESMEGAKKLLAGLEPRAIDVFVIDVPYQEKELRHFHSFLANREFDHVPVIYNDCHFRNQALQENDLIDDVIDLCNFQYDFSSKITFLKKAKQYSFTTSIKKLRVTPEKSVAKRLFDIVIASLLILLLLPLFVLIALAIRLESRGPIFYNAKRAGRGFKIFKFYKFRTMEVNADKKIEALAHLNQYADTTKGARFFKISNDPRITRVGRFLRNTSMDELPQLFNVLKGDMSLVGNRPLPLYEAATLTTNEFVERFMAPAGITGLWQIKKRGNSDMSTEERISLDISYARKSSMLYDLWIMAHTPKALLQKTDV